MGAEAAGGPSVSAIIVNYNEDVAEIERCLSSLRAQTQPPTQLVISDNSPDGRYAAHFGGGDVSVVRNAENHGFTGGTWGGAQVATGELLFFVNPDARLDPSCLESLVGSLLANPEAVIAGAQILLPDGTVNAGDAPVHFSGLSWCGNYRGVPESGEARKAFAVSGCAYLVRASTFQRFHGFRSRFRMYYDDTDLCWRAHIAGLDTMFVPRALVTHNYADKGPHKWLWVERNRLLMLLTNAEARTLLLLLPGLLMMEAGSWLMALREGWWRYKARAYLQVLSDPRWLLSERREIKASRRVPDATIVPQLQFELETPGRPLPSYLRVLNRMLSRYGRWVKAAL